MRARFDKGKHVKNLLTGRKVSLVDSAGAILPGISGIEGAAELIGLGMEIGVDRLLMEPGAEFERHTHPGAHLLYVIKSHGFINVDEVDYDIAAGDSIFVPADYPHGIKTDPESCETFELLAFGVPHVNLQSKSRMILCRQLPSSLAGKIHSGITDGV
jgi:quercetin dioxygenase-like cupin family protein